ncbi:hypothetical protein [Vibrio harveyi]|uniref:hypothetical protein n=1 Tax=Vibrio harveyi TaxID=669 RepID=UPI003CE8315F
MKLEQITQTATTIHKVLVGFEKDYIRNSSSEIKSVLYKNLCEKDFSTVDKQTLKLVIDKQVERLAADSVDDVLLKSETIDDVIAEIASTSNRINKKDLFLDQFYQRKLDTLADKCSESKDAERKLISDFITNFDFKVCGPVSQVSYSYDDDYSLIKGDYEITDDHGIDSLARGFLEFGSKHDDVRDFDDVHIAIDFEAYGYLVSKELNGEFVKALLSQFSKSTELSREYSATCKSNAIYDDIAISLAELCDDLSASLPEFVEVAVLKASKDISSVADCYLHNKSSDIREVQLERISQCLSGHPVAIKCVTEFIERVFDSKDTLQAHIDFKRNLMRQRFQMANDEFAIAEDQFEQNVQEAIEFHKSGESFMFKQKMKTLNVFERAAVTLTVQNEKLKEQDHAVDNSNIVQFQR